MATLRKRCPPERRWRQGALWFGRQGALWFGRQGALWFGRQGALWFGRQGALWFGRQGALWFGRQGALWFGRQGALWFGRQGALWFGRQGALWFGRQGALWFGRQGALWFALAGLAFASGASAQEGAAPAPAGPLPAVGAAANPSAPEGWLVDRVIARFTAPETGGVANPRFIFERELALEARLEALADGGFAVSAATPYLDRHVRAALERHMAETLLQSLEITPPPTTKDLEQRQRFARLAIVEQVGGPGALEQMLASEGIGQSEVGLLLARRARASLYLDRMVATMLTPTDTELRIVHRTTRTPFSAQPYEAIAPLLQRWYVAQRLNAAVRAFYEGARSRIKVTFAAPLAASTRHSDEPARQ